MSELLLNHAKNHLWQSPNQDHQFNIGLARLTKTGGFIGTAKVLWHRVLNPTRFDDKRYFHHLYQVGQLSPITLNLLRLLEVDKWMSVLELIDEHNILIETYFESGAVVPAALIWVMRDYKNNILLAVRHDPNMDYGIIPTPGDFTGEGYSDISADNDYLISRFYTNAIGSNTEFNNVSGKINDTVGAVSQVINNIQDWQSFSNKVVELQSLYLGRGAPLCYKDGFLVNLPQTYHSDMIGYRYSLIWDETYKFRQYFPLTNLPVFKSDKDRGVNKYLLVCDNLYDEIDFFDDVDFYLVSGTLDNYKGVYINRSLPRFIRQVTHNAYALDAKLVDSYLGIHDFLKDRSTVSIMIQVRRGGSVVPVFSQANRIDELFRLPYDKILSALYNVNSLVPEWSARNLENSDYINTLSATSLDNNIALLEGAYGYTGLISELNYPMQPIVNGVVKLPEGNLITDSKTNLQCNSLFIYNDEGLYLGYLFREVIANTCNVSSLSQSGFAECFRLRLKTGSDKVSIYHNQDVTNNHLEDYGFACYVCTELNGKPSNDWVDITGTNYYSYKDKTISWNWGLLTQANLYPCVRINDEVLVSTYNLTDCISQGYLTVKITALQDYLTTNKVATVDIPFATVDVYVNGKAMVEGIDYYLGDNYPNIVIVNTWANNLDSGQITIRAYGIGDYKTVKPYLPAEIGFVTKGVLSVNNHYNVSKNRPSSLVVNSYLTDKSKYKFSEYNEGDLYPVDGRPYMLRDYILPINHLCNTSSSVLYNQMVDIDLRVGSYLNSYLFEPRVLSSSITTERWSLISPICTALLDAFSKGYMDDKSTPKDLTMSNLHDYISPFLSLLPFDPAFKDIDSRFVYIRPHAKSETVAVSVVQWRFLNMVSDLYLNSRIDFTSFVTIGEPS